MPFCTNCGKENPSGARFCGYCGTALQTDRGICANCGKRLEPKEKFCSDCGTPVRNEPPQAPFKAEVEDPKLTHESSSRIDNGPKDTPSTQEEVPPVAAHIRPGKKKGCMARFFRIFALLFTILAAIVLILYFLPDFLPEGGDLTNTNIPGIVDIEPGDVSHLPENRDKANEQVPAYSFTEDKALQETASLVEKAFASADTTKLKNLLTQESLEKYAGIYKFIQPEMAAYSKALASKKLVVKTEMYALYNLQDENGKTFSAEFAQVQPGVWKLVRF